MLATVLLAGCTSEPTSTPSGTTVSSRPSSTTAGPEAAVAEDDPIGQKWLARTPLPGCGEVAFDHNQRFNDVAKDELSCLRAALGDRVGAELMVTFPTIDAGPMPVYFRAKPHGGVEIYTDNTKDPYSTRKWNYFDCGKVTHLPSGPYCPK